MTKYELTFVLLYQVLTLGDTGFFRLQDIKVQIAETANRAESGQLQFWSEPSEILKVRSSNIPENVAFTITIP